MKIITKLKWAIKSILEGHPVGYYLGNKILAISDVFLPHEEDFHGLKKLAVSEKGLFLDIGANDGKSIRSFYKLIKNWRMFSVEANPLHSLTLENLKKKLHQYDYVIGAVGKNDKSLILYTPVYKKITIHSAASVDLDQVKRQMKKQFKKLTIVDKIHYLKTQTQVIHLDDLNLLPDIIKIDIEGMEHIALECLEKTIDHSNPIILVEYNITNFDKLINYLLPKGYRVCGYDIQNDQFVEFDQHRNCFFIPRHRMDEQGYGAKAN